MDALKQDDLDRARRSTPEEKAAQSLDAMRLGLALKLTSLTTRYPTETPEQIEARMRQWLLAPR